MRLLFLFASASIAPAAFVACASSEVGGDREEASTPDAPVSTIVDAAPPDVHEVDAAFARCSKAGWCATPLPDSDLALTDVWPLEGRAFAIAESGTMGVKVLEWTDTEASWKYIDDNTQNELGAVFAGGIWAPNGDTVYYAAGQSYVYRGTRNPLPGSGWSWSHWKLEDHLHADDYEAHARAHNSTAALHRHGLASNPSVGIFGKVPVLGVWGIDAGNVYAWYTNTVYRWTTDGSGAAGWSPVYTVDDWDWTGEEVYFVSAGGSGTDDVWFAGVRQIWANGEGLASRQTECQLLVHETSSGFTRVADGRITTDVFPYEPCTDRPDFPRIGGTAGWLTEIQSTGHGSISALKGATDILRISANNDGLRVDVDPVRLSWTPSSGATFDTNLLRSMWRAPTDVWLTSFGAVIRRQGTGGAGTYAVSTIALNGNPIRGRMYRVRGTSDTNIWATGEGYALHKTTP